VGSFIALPLAELIELHIYILYD